MIDVSEKVVKSSAIPAWSGFVYQGKVALYHAISLLQDGNDANYLKVETLEDFVIHDRKNNVISLHQVKTMQSGYRSAYESALEQASKVVDRCNSSTVRWFHVSTELDDFSDREADTTEGEFIVKFYSYHDGRRYVETGKIDIWLSDIVKKYLCSKGLEITTTLVEHKLAKMQMLLAGRVNLAHHRNQHGGMKKFEAADSIPIYFSEIVECLRSEVIDKKDQEAVLFEFRRTLLDRTDQILDSLQEEESLDLKGIYECRYTVANMESPSLARLYFSKKPNQRVITLSGFSNDTVDQYLRIILNIVGVRVSEDLPHYFNELYGSYLPTAMKFDFLNKKLDVKEIQENIDGFRGNVTVQDVLYDYDNLIVDMDGESFPLDSESSFAGKFTEISENEKNRITKIKNVRFVSVRGAGDEIND